MAHLYRFLICVSRPARAPVPSLIPSISRYHRGSKRWSRKRSTRCVPHSILLLCLLNFTPQSSPVRSIFASSAFYSHHPVARTCNLIFIVLDVLKPLGDKKIIESELEGFGIRLNKRPPQILVRRKEKGGIAITNTVPLTNIDQDEIKAILSEYKINNADIAIREPNATADDLVDVIEGNRCVVATFFSVRSLMVYIAYTYQPYMYSIRSVAILLYSVHHSLGQDRRNLNRGARFTVRFTPSPATQRLNTIHTATKSPCPSPSPPRSG